MNRCCGIAFLAPLLVFLGSHARKTWPHHALSAMALIAPEIHVDRLTAVEQAAADAKSSGDNAWMLTSSALVLLMTGPGLALFYGGLVRKKNVLATMMQSFAMMAVITVLWAVVGYSLAFGAGTQLHRQLSEYVSARSGSAARSRLRRHRSGADLHGFPVDVRHHYARAHHRRFRRAHEIQRHAVVSCRFGRCSSMTPWRTWSGARADC